jgi:hypothetical protein
MNLEVTDQDPDNLAYFRFCAEGRFHLQRCAACRLLRYPPGPSCPWCGEMESAWSPVAGTGTVHSYTEVHHAIQPGFRSTTPYLVLIVELDEQSGAPTREHALRIAGNLVDEHGELATSSQVWEVGIGSRVEMVFTQVGPNIALPNWRLHSGRTGGVAPWRMPATPK